MYGTFVNNDYWVVGPVKIVGINPPSDEYQFVFKPNGSIAGVFSIGQKVTQAVTGAKGTVVVLTAQGDICIEPDSGSASFDTVHSITNNSGASFVSASIINRTRNGSMINIIPATYSSSDEGYVESCRQGFDSEMARWNTESRYYPNWGAYFESLNAARRNGAPISVGNELVINSAVSLVSCVSKYSPSRTIMVSQAILTVIDIVPDEGSFRPSYVGLDKTIKFNKSNLDYSKLNNLDPVDGTPTIADMLSYFQKPWVDFMTGQSGQCGRSLNMPEYSQDIGRLTGEAILRLNVDADNSEKEPLLIALVQLGIDNYGVMLAGKSLTRGMWIPMEGQNMGHKLPIIFAGQILNNPDMLNIGTWWTSADCVLGQDNNWYMCLRSHVSNASNKPVTGSSSSTYWQQLTGEPLLRQQKQWTSQTQYNTGHVFQEDLNVFYVSDADVNRYLYGINKTAYGPPTAVLGIDNNWYRCIKAHIASTYNKPVTGQDWAIYWELTHSVLPAAQKTWDVGLQAVANSTAVIAKQYTASQVGLPEWGSRYYGPYPDYLSNDADWLTAEYRGVCIAGMAGQAMAIHIMGLRNVWDRDVFLDYMDRWAKIGNEGQYISPFVRNMWAEYRDDYLPVWPEKANIIYGDISGDSALSAYDAALCARISVGLDAYPTGDNLTKADVSGGGGVTAYDAALIAQKAVGLITKFPVES